MAKALYYVYDPMCSWCWAFNETWAAIQSALVADIEVRYVLGGLAADTDETMPEAQQKVIRGIWQHIQTQVPGTAFNFDFWSVCTPRRSTYPANRAMLAAKQLDSSAEKPMLLAIQQAYYLHAQNPSDDNVLIECAKGIGLEQAAFKQALNSQNIQQQLLAEIRFARQLGANSFPSLLLEQNDHVRPLVIDYNDPAVVLRQLA